MIDLVSFEVLGLPSPQGSKRAIRIGEHAQLIDGGSDVGQRKTKQWRTDVDATARDIANTEPGTPYDAPLQVSITFRMPMPKSRPAHARNIGWWPHAVKPDLDKLVRATLDGLETGGLIANDSRVFALDVAAYESTGWTGAGIGIRKWEPTQ